VSEEILDRLKHNDIQLGLLCDTDPELARELSKPEYSGSIQRYSVKRRRWEPDRNPKWWPSSTYRLRADFRVAEPKERHQWSQDGDRCVKCGAKDWMGGECRPAKPEVRPPDEYRIVGIGERQKKAFPKDCKVMCTLPTGAWREFCVADECRWLDWLFSFAVPSDYVFAEDRKEPVKERWLLQKHTNQIVSVAQDYHYAGCDITNGWIEITAEQKAYIETKPEPVEGFEWVLKVPNERKKEKFMSVGGALISDCRALNMARLNGIRWTQVPVKVEPRFVEYPIYSGDVWWKCDIEHKNVVARLHELSSIVGFNGVKFLLCDGTESDWTGCLTYHYEAKAPATPIKARFFVGGEK